MENRIQIPAIRGVIGNWVYYQTVMPFSEVVSRIDNDHSIREYKTLDDHLQRELSSRSKKIKDYLLREDSRFFNSVVVGLFGGNPNWYSFDFAPSAVPDMELSDFVLNTVGILELTGGEKLFSIDGQHRIDGIKQAIKERRDKFLHDELPVIIVAHDDSKSGKTRTRRLFSEINTKALKVSGLDDLITNEDNPIDINSRRLYADFVPFGKDKHVLLSTTTNIPATSPYFTTILNLRKVNSLLYDGIYKFKDVRPDNSVIDELYDVSFKFWQKAVDSIPSYNEVLVTEGKDVSDYRNGDDGGSMLFRPVGIELLAEGYVNWRIERGETDEFWQQFQKIEDSLNGDYWKDILWDNSRKKVITAGTAKFRREYLKYLLGLTYDYDYVKVEYTKIKGEGDEVDLLDLPPNP